MIHADLPDSIYEEYFELKKMFAQHSVQVPFDPIRIAFSNPLFFDIPMRGSLLGRKVLVDAGPITTAAGITTMVPRRCGEVAAHCFDRIVVVLEGLPYYVGWIPTEQYRVLDHIESEDDRIKH